MIKNFNEWLTIKENDFVQPNMMAPSGHTFQTGDAQSPAPLATTVGNNSQEEETRLTGRILLHLNLLTTDLDKLTTIPKMKAMEIFDTVVEKLLKFPNINASFLRKSLNSQGQSQPAQEPSMSVQSNMGGQQQ